MKTEISFEAQDDIISSVSVSKTIDVPYELTIREELTEQIDRQCEDPHHFEGNKLIIEKILPVKKPYSLKKTLQKLDREYFYCVR